MKAKLLVLGFLALCLTASPAMAALFGDGGASLQTVLNNHTAPYPGVSSVNVLTDDLADPVDSYWEIQASGGSVTTLVFNLSAAFAPTNTFGLFDMANPANFVQVFAGGDGVGTQKTLGIQVGGAVTINSVPTGVNFSGNAFGYYLDAKIGNQNVNARFYSRTELNADLFDHMYAYRGEGDMFQTLPWLPGVWGPDEYVLAWEDLWAGGDRNFSDLVVMVESVTPVPVPAAVLLGLLGMGVAGLRLRRFA
jgi:hypothetical protein